jgi:DNA (cytosine-5)-methyltransferase 1
MSRTSFTFIDLFCGAGGASIGFERAGFELALATDIDSQALDTLRENLKLAHPATREEAVIHADITDLYELLGVGRVESETLGETTVLTKKAEAIKRKAPKDLNDQKVREFLSGLTTCDVVVGGPPCQGFSLIGRSKRGSAGERASGFVDDPRNILFRYFLKFIERLKPKVVLIENVKGLRSAHGYEEEIKLALRHTAPFYEVEPIVLNAANFGVAQNRERIFFIGVRKDVAKATGIFPSQIIQRLRDSSQAQQISLIDSIGDLPQIRSNPHPNNYESEAEVPMPDPESFGEDISRAAYSSLLGDELIRFINKTHPPKSWGLFADENPTATKERCEEYRSFINKGPDDTLIPIGHLYNHKARYNNDRDLKIYRDLVPGEYLTSDAHSNLIKEIPYGVTITDGVTELNGFADKYFKLSPDRPSKTIVAHLETDGNAFVHPGPHPRSITPREAATNQSFPDWYRFTGPLRQQYRQIGNAVPPLLAFAIAQEFMKLLKSIPESSNFHS